MKQLLAFLIVVSVAAGVMAQQGGDKPKFKKQNVQGINGKSVVTQAEASAVFERARKAITAAQICSLGAKASITATNQPVSRDQIIQEMSKILEASRKSVKFVPAPVKFSPSAFKVGSKGTSAMLAKLVAWGFVAPVGPLATGPKPTISVEDFGDALGFFLSRYSDVTHMPSTKWSPYLQAGG